MPDPGSLVRAVDISVPAPVEGSPRPPVTVFDDGIVRVDDGARDAWPRDPALAYRFDTPDGAVVFSGDTTVNDDLIALAQRPKSSSTRWRTSAISSATV